jgi:hypothetical protein
VKASVYDRRVILLLPCRILGCLDDESGRVRIGELHMQLHNPRIEGG